MVFQRTKTMTWAVTIVYCLFVFAGESLHLLPGCHHGIAGDVQESGDRLSLEKGRALACSHGCRHDPSAEESGAKAIFSTANSGRPHIADRYQDCQICKLMAALASHAPPLSIVVIQPESLCKVNSFLTLPEVGSAPLCLCIRGPPSV